MLFCHFVLQSNIVFGVGKFGFKFYGFVGRFQGFKLFAAAENRSTAAAEKNVAAVRTYIKFYLEHISVVRLIGYYLSFHKLGNLGSQYCRKVRP